jgi:threonine aldolase
MIDLVSDTVTQPTPEMRKFMAEAEVGDSQRGEDPTVNRLQDAVAELLDKDGAIFLPSATMANQIAYKVFTRPGDEIIMDYKSHPILFEGGACAFLSGVMIHYIHGDRGIFGEDDVVAAIRPDEPDEPPTTLVSVENTNNQGEGKVWPMNELMAVSTAAHEHGLKVHMDGSRLMNAVVASGIRAREYAAYADSVTICFSKGLGAPVGATIAGEKSFLKEARRMQQRFGGSMREAGIIAAGALYGLQHNVERLADDHANAKLLAGRLADEEGISINPDDVETNILFFRVEGTGLTSKDFTDRLLERGVRMGWYTDGRVRAVTHLGVSRQETVKAADTIHAMLAEYSLKA